jgi:hypothetical protein
MYIYHNILKKLNVLQIYLYNINIYFGIGLGEFWIRFDNIYTLFIIYQIRLLSKKYPFIQVGIQRVEIKLSSLLKIH